ncbi:hypothetical protein HQQ80_05025 [Microbacteriaceae bacterium VKM Ac-2855]|nr:hypothetical protein [Microbacteriaceae bacterium VKM Ac-2855]
MTDLPMDRPLSTLAEWIGHERAVEVTAWAFGMNVIIEPERLLTPGLSGAVVGMVTARSTTGHGDRRLVLKLNPGAANSDEGERHSRALDADRKFAEAHLVELFCEPLPLSDGSGLILQQFAGGDRQVWQPLSSLTGKKDMTRSLATITTSIIKDWNDDVRAKEAPPLEILGARVAKRTVPNGRIPTWLADEFGEECVSATRLRFTASKGDRLLYNPLILARPENQDYRTIALVGNSHGDLHVENVLLPIMQQAQPDLYRLIDLAHFDTDRSLSDDPANLLLSEIERAVASWPTGLSASLLDWIEERDDSRLPSELAAITDAWSSVEECGSRLALERNYGSEWRTQFWLSICGSALVLSSRDRLAKDTRLWFFELASIAATQWILISKLKFDDTSQATIGPEISPDQQAAIAAAREISAECCNFDARVVSIAVIPDGGLNHWERVRLASAGWDVVVDFDTLTDEVNGSYRFMKEVGDQVRLLIPTQQPSWSRNWTTWLAAAGLEPVGSSTRTDRSFREWRRTLLPSIELLASNLATSFVQPFKLFVFGEPDDRARSVIDAILDAAGDRALVTLVHQRESALLGGYSARLLAHDANTVALAINPKPIVNLMPDALATLPGNDGGRVVLSPINRKYLEDGYEILHSLIVFESESIDGVGVDFYSGRQITWFELSNDVDLFRDPAVGALKRALASKLAKRSTDRHVFGHFPGAGGTTVTRRVAWEFRDSYPVIVVSRLAESNALADRIELLAKLTDQKVLVVIEAASSQVTDALYDRLRSNSVAALILLVSRASYTPKIADAAKMLPPMDHDEAVDFKRFFTAIRPDRHSAISRLGAASSPESPVPFIFALTAFHDDFVGLSEYVHAFLEEVEVDLLPVVILTALSHRYGATSIHSSMFSRMLARTADEAVALRDYFGTKFDGLLLEERAGYWRTPHSLIAEQILRECLTPIEGASRNSRGAWKTNLAYWSETLIKYVAEATTGELSFDYDELLKQLFIKREVRGESDRARYSDLIDSLPYESRERVFVALTECFPEEAHYWAHFSRWQSSDLRNHDAARESMDEAIRIRNDDPVILHMKGTNARRELFDYLERHRHPELTPVLKNEVGGEVERIARMAIDAYDRATQLDDTSDYPLISTAELCLSVIEWGKSIDGSVSYAGFLRKVSSAFYSELLDKAEDCVDAVGEVEGDDQPSNAIRSVRARLEGVYDDYSAMIEGYRNILDTTMGSKTALRVRLARLYGQRSGGWSSASPTDVEAAMSLLNASLRDNPTDGATLRVWLKAGRVGGISLSRALEVVSTWVEHDTSRDALYYDCVLTSIHALNGGLVSADELSGKIERMKSRSRDFKQRRTVFDWLGNGTGLDRLVNKADVAGWERRTSQSPPAKLMRVRGRVNELRGPTRGTILLKNDIEAFFTPSIGNFLTGQDDNAIVSAVIGFSYDGLQAWSVERERR